MNNTKTSIYFIVHKDSTFLKHRKVRFTRVIFVCTFVCINFSLTNIFGHLSVSNFLLWIYLDIPSFLSVLKCKHRKNCKCCHHHSVFKGHNVIIHIVVLNCQKCDQCFSVKSQVTKTFKTSENFPQIWKLSKLSKIVKNCQKLWKLSKIF